MSFENSSFPGFRGSTWRLLPKHGQVYSVSKNILGNEQQQNWIVSNLDLQVKSKRGLKFSSSQKSPKDKTPAVKRKEVRGLPVNQEEFEKRLQFLKNLLDKQLINESEYERKRKELLDQFF